MDFPLLREFELHLSDVVRRRMAERWLAENKDALAAYNEFIEQNGVFSEGAREF
ncbi:MAG: type II toxin-antitoxin system CcdA family antitoxin [Rhodocyclaceae bacterium]|nr:type II toxin-antitoxin system CcdA family antitoxin [Rhodocyclaceae bacterium]